MQITFFFATIATFLALVTLLLGFSSEDSEPRRQLHQNHQDEGKRVLVNGDNCMEVILTGTMGGPPLYNGLAGPGTLITYGSVENDCRDTLLQFDAGRGTSTQLSKLGLEPGDINAVFFTHMHNDHTEDLSVFLFHRWLYSPGNNVDVVCSEDTTVQGPANIGTYTISCRNYVDHIGDAFIASGEVQQRLIELSNPPRDPRGPAGMANVITFGPSPAEAIAVWTSNDGLVTVKYITSNHIGGHASYLIETPADSAVIGGDSSNDITDPTLRSTSTSAQVELIANGVDVLVQSSLHPVLAVPESTFPSLLYNRQSNLPDIAAMAERAGVKTLMLTHLAPPIGSPKQGRFHVVGGPLEKDDYLMAAKDGGYTGDIVVGTDLATSLASASAPAPASAPTPASASASTSTSVMFRLTALRFFLVYSAVYFLANNSFI